MSGLGYGIVSHPSRPKCLRPNESRWMSPSTRSILLSRIVLVHLNSFLFFRVQVLYSIIALFDETSRRLEKMWQDASFDLPVAFEDLNIHGAPLTRCSIGSDEVALKVPIIDGGLEGWICVLGSFFAMFCAFGWLNT